MSNLANTYRPSTWEDVVEQPVAVNILQNICKQDSLENRNFLFVGPAGTGKAQPLYSKILTPQGFIEMKDVVVGTHVYTHSGNLAEVSGVFPQGVRDIYVIHLSDGSTIHVSDNHLNCVIRVDETGESSDIVISTQDLLEIFSTAESNCEFYVDSVFIPYNSSSVVSYDPYIAGVVIGGAIFVGGKWLLNCHSAEIFGTINSKLLNMFGCGLEDSTYSELYEICPESELFENFISKFVETDCSDCSCDADFITHRFIPKELLFSDATTRLSVLRGILDAFSMQDFSDEYAKFSTFDSRLSADFASLVRSLGIVDNIQKCTMSVFHEEEFSMYEHTIKLSYFPNTWFKSCNFTPSGSLDSRRIVDIVYAGRCPCQCIYVDHEDHTYISDNYIPTHNTTLARILANELNSGCGEPIEVDAASNNGIDNIREIIKQARQYPIGSKYKVFIIDEVHALSSASFQALLKILEEVPAKTVFALCTTNPEKIPETILSRVQTFQLTKISVKGITDRLRYVIETENQSGRGITFTEDALSYLAKLSGGCLRKALMLLDKLLVYSTDVNSYSIESALNIPNYQDYFELLNHYAKHSREGIVNVVDRVYNSGVNFSKWFEGFHAFVINVCKYILLHDIEMTTIPSHYEVKMKSYGNPHLNICLKLSTVLIQILNDLRHTDYLQEVALTYLCNKSN